MIHLKAKLAGMLLFKDYVFFYIVEQKSKMDTSTWKGFIELDIIC